MIVSRTEIIFWRLRIGTQVASESSLVRWVPLYPSQLALGSLKERTSPAPKKKI